MTSLPSATDATLRAARATLLATRDERGAFVGHLSSSALSTATAAMAMELLAKDRAQRGHDTTIPARLAADGRRWLLDHQNDDGGFGDTIDSQSNISTTTLCWVSLGLVAESSQEVTSALASMESWLRADAGDITPAHLAKTLRARYGKDQTFSVPILTTCAIGGRLGEGRAAWRHVPSLPFELAACPQSWFHRLRIPMVSYALPALIAIGQVRHHHRPSWNPLTRMARVVARKRTLRILADIQPDTGGYLEAAPLTSFVTMAMISMGLAEHPVTKKAIHFLESTVRDDGSWPIDTNLDTWTTTLAINGLNDPTLDHETTEAWLRAQQYAVVHPYTNAAPGGFAWTDLPGGVPDADDTAGALLALMKLAGEAPTAAHIDAASKGVQWLLGLQNKDGGIPTFCRGFGILPFDTSNPDITAHGLRAFAAVRPHLGDTAALDRGAERAIAYLCGVQRLDGAWVPLWFGNQLEASHENPLYGTSRVVRAVSVVRSQTLADAWDGAGMQGVAWLLRTQSENGGFGGARGLPPTIEETALAVEALAAWLVALKEGRFPLTDGDKVHAAVTRGVAWLVEKTREGTEFEASPIGLYFAKLWYSERLYPVLFTVAALTLAQQAARLERP